MVYTWAWGYEPDEWLDDDWYDANGNYHDASELGGLRKIRGAETEDDKEEIAF